MRATDEGRIEREKQHCARGEATGVTLTLEAWRLDSCARVWVSARVTVARRRRFVIFMALKRFVSVDEY